MTPLVLYCDGAGAERVDRAGGWAWLAVSGDVELASASGHAARTTCLVMELTAALEALEACLAAQWHLQHAVVLASDCTIVLEAATGAFTPRPAKYHPLCARLRAALLETKATTRWVKGHAGQRWNEAVDARAAAARDIRGPQTVGAARAK